MAASSTTSAPVWGAEVDHVLDQLTKLVTAAVCDATDALAYSAATIAAPSATHSIGAFSAALAPTLDKHLARLRFILQRNVFCIPPGVDVDALHNALRDADGAHARREETRLDAEIAAARAQIRDVEVAIRDLANMKESAAQHLSLMKRLSDDMHISGSENIAQLLHNVDDAANDLKAGENILKAHRLENSNEQQQPLLRAAANVLSSTKCDHSDLSIAESVFGENLLGQDDEHGPMQHFVPSAQSILKISLGGESEKLQQLCTLRARLLG